MIILNLNDLNGTKYEIIEAGEEGDCLFKCLALALGSLVSGRKLCNILFQYSHNLNVSLGSSYFQPNNIAVNLLFTGPDEDEHFKLLEATSGINIDAQHSVVSNDTMPGACTSASTIISSTFAKLQRKRLALKKEDELKYSVKIYLNLDEFLPNLSSSLNLRCEIFNNFFLSEII